MAKTTVRMVESNADLEALYAFRYQVYVKELGMTDQADHIRQWLSDGYDEEAVHYALFEDDQIVGSLRCLFVHQLTDPSPLIDKFAMQPAIDHLGIDTIVTTSRFMIAPHLRSTMAIFRLMQTSFRDSLEAGILVNYGDCSPHLLPFYEHLGYRRYTSGFNDSAFGYKLPILMMVRDRDFLTTVRSPLARLLKSEDDHAQSRDWFETTYADYLDTISAMFMPDDLFFDMLAERVASDPLHSVSLLQGLTKEQATTFLREATLIDVKPGDKIIRTGDRDNTLFVLLSGLAEVRTDDGTAPPLSMRGAGDTFGEIGYLTTVPRTADVIAVTDGEVLVLSADFMNRLTAKEPTIAARVMHNLARELASNLAIATQRLTRDNN